MSCSAEHSVKRITFIVLFVFTEIVTTPETTTTTTETETSTTAKNITDIPSTPKNLADPIFTVDPSTTAKTPNVNVTVKTTTPVSTTVKSEGINSNNK